MSHLLVVAVSVVALLFIAKLAFDWLEERNRQRQALAMMSRLRSMDMTSHPEKTAAKTADPRSPSDRNN